MKPLFTQEEFDKAKGKDKLGLLCYTCNQSFFKEKFKFRFPDQKHKYCSKECQSKGQLKKQEIKCLNCNKSVSKIPSEIKKHLNQFCSHSCSAIFNNKIKYGNETEEEKLFKKEQKKIKNNLVQQIIRSKPKDKECFSCKIYFISYTEKGKYCESCNFYKSNLKIFEKLNLDKEKSFKENGLLALEILKNEYFNNKLSSLEIYEKYKIKENTLSVFFKKHNINLRSVGESFTNGIETGRKQIPYKINPTYKQNWFVTWEGKEFFYRSSYELNYINYLEKNKISYDMETLRIRYFDTNKNKERVAIPDFYLIATNTIVEIKSRHRFDFQNMIDRYKKFKELGYNFKLIYEHEEYIEDDFQNKLYQAENGNILIK